MALFIGAGASIGAGLPGWFDLLEEIEKEITGKNVIGDECNWDPYDMAEKLELESDK